MRITSDTIGVPVSDVPLERSHPDLEPASGSVEYQMTETTWLQLYEGSVTPNDGVLRIGVPDLHPERGRLLAMGVAVGAVEEVPSVVAYCDVQDPDGTN